MTIDMSALRELANLRGYRNMRIVKDKRLSDQKVAEMYDGDDVIRVSPAMFELLGSDFENMAKVLKVRISSHQKNQARS